MQTQQEDTGVNNKCDCELQFQVWKRVTHRVCKIYERLSEPDAYFMNDQDCFVPSRKTEVIHNEAANSAVLLRSADL